MSKFNLDLFKMGYILAYKATGSLFNRLIEKRQLEAGFKPSEAEFVHTEISGGEKHSVNISPPFSKLIDITRKHKGRYVKVLRYKADDFAAKRYKIAYFSGTLCNKVYDFSGILSFLFKWITHNNRLYFCSEGCAWAYKMVYPRCFAKPANEVMPADFVASSQFECAFEGIIEEKTQETQNNP